MLYLPLIILSLTASYISALGLVRMSPAPFPIQCALAAALHACYVLPPARRKFGLSCISASVCLYLTQGGMTTLRSAHPIFIALVLEGVCRLLAGPDAIPASISERIADESLRMAARLADAENRLRARISRLALPRQLEESIRTHAARIVAKAETSAAERSIELENLVLEAAAQCRGHRPPLQGGFI